MAKNDPTYHYLVELRRARKQRDQKVLIEALDNQVEAPRAARFLSSIGAHEAVPKLRELLATTDAPTRNAAVVALGNLQAHDAASDIARIANSDPVQWVRSYALVASRKSSAQSPARSCSLRSKEIRIGERGMPQRSYSAGQV